MWKQTRVCRALCVKKTGNSFGEKKKSENWCILNEIGTYYINDIL